MSLTWHMVRSDLRRLRWPLFLWLAVLAATPLFGAFLLRSDGGTLEWFRGLADAGAKMAVMEVLTGLMLVPLLLHSDPVVGNTAFWITRPIAPQRLWRAKLGGLGVIFGVVPVLVLLPWWLACGYGPREVGLATAETLLWQAAIVALALPMAALTDGFSRYFMWLLVVVAAIATSTVFLLFIPELSTRTAYDLMYVWTRAWSALAAFLIGGCVAAAWQFHRRRMSQSFVILGLTAIVALTALGYWPREFSPQRPAGSDEKPGPVAAGVQVVFEQAMVERVNQQHADLSTGLSFTGVPDDMILSAAWDLGREGRQPAEHVWTWETGLRLERQGWIQYRGQWLEPELVALGLPAAPLAAREWNRVWWARANERRQKNGLPPLVYREGRWADARVQVPLAFAKRTQLEPPRYRLRLAFDVTKPSVADEKPLRVGEKLHVGRTTARVTHLANHRLRGTQRNSTLMESSPLLLVDAGPVSLVPLFRSMRREPHYLLVNRARGNAVGSADGTWGRFGTVKVSRHPLPQSPPWELRDGKWVTSQDWFDEGLTVAAMTYEWRERFVQEVVVEEFELGAAAVAGGAR